MTLAHPDPAALDGTSEPLGPTAAPTRSGSEAASSRPARGAALAAATSAARLPRPWWRRSLLLSAGAHGVLVVSAFGLYRAQLGRSGELGPPSTVRLERSVNATLLPEERPEPERTTEVPATSTEPELVEVVITPEPWPEEPEPDAVPLDDPLTGVPAFKRPPAPLPVAITAPVEPGEVPEVVEAASAPAPEPPAASAPRELTGDELPDVIDGPLPRYPRQAVRMGWRGTVRLRIRVDADGKVIGVEVTESSGHDVLDDAAVEAFERWVFAPKRASDPDVRVLGKPFTFRIR